MHLKALTFPSEVNMAFHTSRTQFARFTKFTVIKPVSEMGKLWSGELKSGAGLRLVLVGLRGKHFHKRLTLCKEQCPTSLDCTIIQVDVFF